MHAVPRRRRSPTRYGEPCGALSIPIAPFAICARHARELLEQRAREYSPVPAEDRGTVYYVQIGPHVKIGHTVNLSQRMRVYPPTRRLLATERGGRELESVRLREFRHLLDMAQEWFRPGPDLIAHINDLRVADGAQPISTAA